MVIVAAGEIVGVGKGVTMPACIICGTQSKRVYCTRKCQISAYRTGPIRWEDLRDFALTVSGWKCRECGTSLLPPNKHNVHHVIPLQDGGKNEIGNLATLCLPCHKVAHTRHAAIARSI